MITRRVRYEIVVRALGPALMAMERWRSRQRGRRGGGTEGPFGPPLESTRKLKELTTLHYLTGRFADGAVPVAWVTSGFPVEMLRPLGFHTVYPENHGAICSVKRMVPELSEAVEREGYSRDLCGYARADLGSVATGKTPVGRLPRPDLLCCCTNICQTVLYWYRALAAHFRVPLVVIDTPFVYGEAEPHLLAYVADQLRELTETAERVAGRKVDRAALAETMRLAREGTRLWDECLRAGRTRPSPWTGFDSFFHLAPIVSMRGTRECNAYYRMLRDELNDRVARGVGGIVDERVRLLWDNLPIWFNLRDLSTVLAEERLQLRLHHLHERVGRGGLDDRPGGSGRLRGAGLSPRAPQPGSAAQAFDHEAALPGVRCDRRHLPQRPFVQAVLDRADRPAGTAVLGGRGKRVAAGGGSRRSPRLVGGAGVQPPSRLHGAFCVTATGLPAAR